MTGGAPVHKQESSLGKAFDVGLMRFLWRFVKPHLGLVILGLILIPGALVFELAQPYLLKIAIEDHIGKSRLQGLDTIAFAYIGCVILQAAISYAQNISLQLVGQRSMHGLRIHLHNHILTQSRRFYDKTPLGQILTRLTGDVESINEMFASGVVTLIADFLKLIAIVAIMIYMSPVLTLMTFLTFPLLIWLVNYARKIMRRSFRRIRTQLASMNSFTQEYLSGVSIVQLSNRHKQAVDSYEEQSASFRDAYKESIRADASMYALVEAIGTVSIASIAWYASSQILGQPSGNTDSVLTVGLIIAFIEYINKFFVPIRDFSAKYAIMQSAMAATERITEMLDATDVDGDLPVSTLSATPGPTTTNFPATTRTKQDDIVFQNVHFSYSQGTPILNNLKATIQAHTKVAIVGATGCGKSTIIKLLTRLYDPQSGTIFVGGVPTVQWDLQALRNHITVVSQDVFLYQGSLGDNVRIGKPNATDEEVMTALVETGAAALFASKSSGQSGDKETPPALVTPDLESSQVEMTTDLLALPVLTRGDNFSAGEKQLIAFARAWVRNPPILVLDEATAHVDPSLEHLIEGALHKLMENKTSLVIAHRLTTVRSADQILVMDKGIIVESGNHKQLLAQNGLYAKLEKTFSKNDSSHPP